MNYDNTITEVTAEAKAGFAELRISGIINEDTEFSAANIRGIVSDFVGRGINKAKLYLNCKGGNVFEATEIDNELEKFSELTIYIGALAASAAIYITSNPKYKVIAKPNSQIMIHRPSIGTYGDIKTIKSDTRLLENITNDYKKRYAVKTGMSENDIEALWDKGDYWMNAKQAKEMKFINEVENSVSSPASFYNSISASALDVNERSAWTLEDYLDKAPKAYEQMKTINPQLAARLEADYFGSNQQKNNMVNGSTPASPVAFANDYSRASWTLEDYLDKDPKAYEEMKTTNPQLAAQLERKYFGK